MNKPNGSKQAGHSKMPAGMVAGVCLTISAIAAVPALQHYRISNPAAPPTGVPGISTTAIRSFHDIGHSRLSKTASESALDYLQRISNTVHLSTYQCDPQNFELSFLDRVSYRALFASDDLFSQGMLYGPRFACGFCHQRAFIAQRLLKEHGVASNVYTLDGHVVVRAVVGGVAYFADPDFGVGPFEDTGNPDDLRRSAEILYVGRARHVRIPTVAEMYASYHNNGPYAAAMAVGGSSYLDAMHTKQDRLFRLSDTIASGLTAASLFSALYGLHLMRGLFWTRLSRRMQCQKSCS